MGPPRGMGWLGARRRAPQPLFPTCTVWPRSSHARSRPRLGKLQAATADFVFKPDFNLERFGQPNIEQNSRFTTAQLMASLRAVRIGSENLIPESGRRYPQKLVVICGYSVGPGGEDRCAIKT